MKKEKYTYSFIKQWLELNNKDKTKSIIDLGCGDGDLVECLLSDGYSAEGIEVDFFHETIAKKISKSFIDANTIHLLKSDDDIIPFYNKYNLLISHMVYEHVKDKTKFINQVYNLLKENGKALLFFPSKEVLRESHIQQFFIHRLPKNMLRYFVSYAQCLLGFGYKKNNGISKEKYISNKFEDIDMRCFYETSQESMNRFKKYFSVLNLEPEYVKLRLGLSGLKMPGFFIKNVIFRSIVTSLLRLYSFTIIELTKI